MEFDTATPTGNNRGGGNFFTPSHNIPTKSVEYADDPRNCNAINKEASIRLARDKDKLQADGSNFCSWLNKITEFSILSLDDPEFYDRPQPDGPKEVVACSSLLILIHRDVRQYLYGPLSSFQIMSKIKHWYTVFSQAAQLNHWTDLEHLQRSGGGLSSPLRPATTCPEVSPSCHIIGNNGLWIKAGVNWIGPLTFVEVWSSQRPAYPATPPPHLAFSCQRQLNNFWTTQ
ncbi:hypothetical protein PCASD_16344 [Puccinia coronata f. sp. avenae]|uniref:Uncharacterized protein n=1 Tax=Puccinia coronata f. sp. avenae TaxID=200324 RepID=A0A2N5S398_9BASI|nr:hypothetical protein PCASD_26416 [Puccinia coronata f. sp. avenae]PLW37041.1 hypothetical protein PCASD_16344 [Puccinia coronata f. sp. avenae]